MKKVLSVIGLLLVGLLGVFGLTSCNKYKDYRDVLSFKEENEDIYFLSYTLHDEKLYTTSCESVLRGPLEIEAFIPDDIIWLAEEEGLKITYEALEIFDTVYEIKEEEYDGYSRYSLGTVKLPKDYVQGVFEGPDDSDPRVNTNHNYNARLYFDVNGIKVYCDKVFAPVLGDGVFFYPAKECQ